MKNLFIKYWLPFIIIASYFNCDNSKNREPIQNIRTPVFETIEAEIPWKKDSMIIQELSGEIKHGEFRTINISVSGLSEIKDPIPLRLENQSLDVARMYECDIQTIIIEIEDIENDVFRWNSTIYGIADGNFDLVFSSSPSITLADPWHIIKEYFTPDEEQDYNKEDAKEDLCEWVDTVVEDLKEKKRKLEEGENSSANIVQNTIAAIDGAINNLPACCTTASMELDERKNCIDRYLVDIRVITTGAALWSLGFEALKASISAITSGDLDCETIEAWLDFLIAIADATDNKNFKNKLEATKDICGKVKKGKKTVEKLTDELEKLTSELEKMQKVK